jgi:hypothetical protein
VIAAQRATNQIEHQPVRAGRLLIQRAARSVVAVEFYFSVSLLPLATAWRAVSKLAPQPVAFYAGVFFLVNLTYLALVWDLVGHAPAVRGVSLRLGQGALRCRPLRRLVDLQWLVEPA